MAWFCIRVMTKFSWKNVTYYLAWKHIYKLIHVYLLLVFDFDFWPVVNSAFFDILTFQTLLYFLSRRSFCWVSMSDFEARSPISDSDKGESVLEMWYSGSHNTTFYTCISKGYFRSFPYQFGKKWISKRKVAWDYFAMFR